VEQAVPWARRLHGTLDLAFASEWSTEGLPPPTAPTDELDELWQAWQERAADERRALVALQQGVPQDVRGAERFVTGRPVEALPDVAATYDLLIVASHARKGLERVLLGSVTQRLIRHVQAPTLVVGVGDPPVSATDRLRVLAPLDEGEDGALPWIAQHLAQERIELVHVLPPDRWLPRTLLGDTGLPSDPAVRRQTLEEQLAARAAAYGQRTAPVHMVHRDTSNPGDAIAGLANRLDVDLIVLPTHTRTTLERWFIGSVAERVVERAPCPVLIVPQGVPV
jgi:nucleotide-binding universal stress UspA family protein